MADWRPLYNYVTPPTIKLLGPGTFGDSEFVIFTVVEVGTGIYTDPGATVTDDTDSNINSKLWTTFSPSFVDISRPTAVDRAFSVVYSVSDTAGNKASQFDVYGRCPDPVQTSTSLLPCDRGAIAMDDVEGDISRRITACWNGEASIQSSSLFILSGLSACKLDPKTWGAFTITFSVTNSAGRSAAVSRTLKVTKVCDPGSTPCSDGSCSGDDGLCRGKNGVPNLLDLLLNFTDATASATGAVSEPMFASDGSLVSSLNTQPEIALVQGSNSKSEIVSVRQFKLYRACLEGEDGRNDVLCERGAAAFDKQDGDLTFKVLACPPADCLDAGCPGHEFIKKGIVDCGVDTSADVVFDSGTPPLRSQISRSIIIGEPCEKGTNYCDGICTEVSCTTYAALVAKNGGVPLIPKPPKIVFTSTSNAGKRRGLGSQLQHIDSRHRFSSRRSLQQSGDNSSTSMKLRFGTGPADSLVPCNGKSLFRCGVKTTDYLGTDLSSRTVVQDVSSCPAKAVCFLCTPDALEANQYFVKDDGGRQATADAYIIIELRTKYTMTFTAIMDCSAGTANLITSLEQAEASAFQNLSSHYFPLLGMDLDYVREAVLNSVVIFDTGGPQSQLDGTTQYCSVEIGCASYSPNFQSDSLCQCSADWNYNSVGATAQAPPYEFEGLLGPLISFDPTPTVESCYVVSKLFNSTEAALLASLSTTSAVDQLSTSLDLYLGRLQLQAYNLHGLMDEIDSDVEAAWVRLMTKRDESISSMNWRLDQLYKILVASGPDSLTTNVYTSSGTLKDTAAQVIISNPGLEACIANRGALSSRFHFVVPAPPDDPNKTDESEIESLLKFLGYGRRSRQLLAEEDSMFQGGYPDVMYDVQDMTISDYGLNGRDRIVGTSKHVVRRSEEKQGQVDKIQCSSLYGALMPESCSADTHKSNASRELPGVGIDPVFSRRSDLYDAEIANQPYDWYNSSSESGQVNQFEVPFGFFPEAMPGFPDGYPAFFDVNLGASRAQWLLKYIAQGAYLTKDETSSVSARIVTYSRPLQLYGYVRMVFEWVDGGRVECTFFIRALEYKDYSFEGLGYSVMTARFVVDVVLILIVTWYCCMTAVDIWISIRHQFKSGRMQRIFRKLGVDYQEAIEGATEDADNEVGYEVDKEQAPGGKDKSKDKDKDRGPSISFMGKKVYGLQAEHYRAKITPFWFMYELILCACMIAAVSLLMYYAVNVSATMPNVKHYAVYDASSFAPARPFMLHRNEQASDTHPPGTAGRWMLDEDREGLSKIAESHNHLEHMNDILLWYGILQGITLTLAMIRVMVLTSFQVKLSVISGTIAMALPDLAVFGVTAVCICMPLSVLYCIIYGTEFEEAKNINEACAFVFKLSHAMM
eukprot:gene31297-6445_t